MNVVQILKKMKMNKQINRKIMGLFEKYKVPSDLLDYEALYDNTLTEGENLNTIREYIEVLSSSNDFNEKVQADLKVKKKTIKSEKEEIEKVELDNFKKEAEHSEKEFEKALNNIKFKSTNELEKAFKITKKLITTLVKSENIHGLILKGGAGIGKSFTTIKTLKDLKLKKGRDYEIMLSYTTPLELYQFLYENRDDKVIILDDTMGFFDNKINIGIVLSALWGEGKRIVHYHSSSGKLKVPQSFIFNSKIIWCANDVKDIEAVKSRCFYHELNFSYNDKIKLFYEIGKIKGIKTEVIDFIKENSDELTKNLDFRLVIKINDMCSNNKEWKDLAIDLLGKSDSLLLLKNFLNECSQIKDAEEKWCKETGYSRKTFYNYKNKLSVKV